MSKKSYPSMYDLAASTNANTRAQTKLAGATVGAVIGQSVAQGQSHREAMQIAHQQLAAMEDGFDQVISNQQVQIENQYAAIQNQVIQTRALEAIYGRMEEIDKRMYQHGKKLDAINRGQFAQWRQTDEGRLYMDWERLALKLLRFRDTRDAVVQQLPVVFWEDAGLGEKPTVYKPMKVSRPELKELSSTSAKIAFAIGAAIVALLSFMVGRWSAEMWWTGFFASIGSILGWALCIALVSVSFGLLVGGVFGDRAARKENAVLLQKYQNQARAAKAHNRDREEAIVSFRTWRDRRDKLTREIGVEPGQTIDWMTAEDRNHLAQIEEVVLTSRDQYPAPTALPVLYVPEAVGDPSTRVGAAILALNESSDAS